MLTYADESFDPMLEIGFGSAIRREWAWRVKRGESLANLQAFAHFVRPQLSCDRRRCSAAIWLSVVRTPDGSGDDSAVGLWGRPP